MVLSKLTSWRRSVLSIHWKDWCWSWNALATWGEELTHLKRPWCWERLKAGQEGDDRGWNGWMTSPTQWTWVWVNSGSWWWIGKPGVLQSMGLQRVGHDWAAELNWTEANSPYLLSDNKHLKAWGESSCLFRTERHLCQAHFFKTEIVLLLFFFALKIFFSWVPIANRCSKKCFLGSSAAKESGHNARDPGLILRSGRSPEEGLGCSLQYSWASLVAQIAKNPPAMIHLQCRRPGFNLWVGKIPWRRAWQPTPVFLPGESPWTAEPGRLQAMGLQSWTQLSEYAQHSSKNCLILGQSGYLQLQGSFWLNTQDNFVSTWLPGKAHPRPLKAHLTQIAWA